MGDIVDDSDLHSIMTEATKIIDTLKNSKERDSFELLEKAKRVENATEAYISRRQRGYNQLNEEVNRAKSRVQVNKELLKTTISNVSLLRSKLNSESPFKNKPGNMEFFTGATKDNIDQKLNEVKMKIQNATRDLSSKSKSGSKLEKMLRRYQGILEETTCLFKKVPDILQSRSSPSNKADWKETEDTDRRALHLLNTISSLKVHEEVPDLPEAVGEPQAGVGNWIHYEGFDTQEELDRFKELYRKMTGQDPDEEINIPVENTLEVLEEEPSENSDFSEMSYVEKLFKELIQTEEFPQDENGLTSSVMQ